MELSFNMADFERLAKNLRGAVDQVPFALSRALNDAAKSTRQTLVKETWPSHVTQRNPAFINRALRTEFSTKQNLRVKIYDDLGRGHLALHAFGGTKQARRRLAIPIEGAVRRGAHGVVGSQKPKALIAKTPKRALRITPKGIFVGKGGRLYMKYAFRPSARQPADVPFISDFERSMRSAVRESFPRAMAEAMRTRR